MPESGTAEKTRDADGSGLDKVRDEFSKYLMAKASSLVTTAGKKAGGLAERVAEGGGLGEGLLPEPVEKMLKGDSPVKAVGGQVAKSVKDNTLGKVQELFGGGGKAGNKKVTNIIEILDIGLPLRRVYDHWTEFEEFSSFMKGVVEASRAKDEEDVTSDWTLKVGPSKRSWKATVLEQVPDNRIVWKSTGDKATTHGGVSFHELTPSLTRIVVVIEYSPGGFFEKTGNLWRVQGRRLRLDLKHFQRYVTLGVQEVPEGWRGEIREGELVHGHEEGLAEDESDEERDENAEAEDEYEDDYDDEAAEEDGEFEDEGQDDGRDEGGR